LQSAGGFRSLQEQIDTTTSGGKLVFHVFGALAEFERDLIRERTHAGLQATRARGRLFGRPKVLTPQQVKQLRSLAKDERNTVSEICETLGISRATYYRYVNKQLLAHNRSFLDRSALRPSSSGLVLRGAGHDAVGRQRCCGVVEGSALDGRVALSSCL
jgi:hypothetical protein